MINTPQPVNTDGKWLVLWIRGKRVASWPLHDRAAIERYVSTSWIQTDANGSEHVEVMRIKGKR